MNALESYRKELKDSLERLKDLKVVATNDRLLAIINQQVGLTMMKISMNKVAIYELAVVMGHVPDFGVHPDASHGGLVQ